MTPAHTNVAMKRCGSVFLLGGTFRFTPHNSSLDIIYIIYQLVRGVPLSPLPFLFFFSTPAVWIPRTLYTMCGRQAERQTKEMCGWFRPDSSLVNKSENRWLSSLVTNEEYLPNLRFFPYFAALLIVRVLLLCGVGKHLLPSSSSLPTKPEP